MALIDISNEYSKKNVRLSEQSLDKVFNSEELQAFESEVSGASYQTLSSLIAGEPLGNQKFIGNNIILTSLCPFINIPGGDYPQDLREVNGPPEFIINNNGNRAIYLQQWLNYYTQQNTNFVKLLVPLPIDFFEVELPLDLSLNPWYNIVRKDLLFYLIKIYEKVKVGKLHISSAYRSPEYNATYGNVDYDSHIIGCAVDILGSKDLINEIYSLADSMGIGGIGKGTNIIHLDLNYRARWIYNE